MRIRTKEEVINAYNKRYPELDEYFITHLEEEYDGYYDKIKCFQSKDEVLAFFESEIEKNDKKYSDNAEIAGVERALNNQYMDILAAYGLIVFFRDNIIE